jgi:hypothetical protein
LALGASISPGTGTNNRQIVVNKNFQKNLVNMYFRMKIVNERSEEKMSYTLEGNILANSCSNLKKYERFGTALKFSLI